MGHVILLSELARAKPSRPRDPAPEGGATISLFLGVRYERWGTAQNASKHETSTREASQQRVNEQTAREPVAKQRATSKRATSKREDVPAGDASFVA
jgi:hypothetical protein